MNKLIKETSLGLTKRGQQLILVETEYNLCVDVWSHIKEYLLYDVKDFKKIKIERGLFYKTSAIIDREGFNAYIREYAPKQLKNIVDEEYGEDCFQCYVVSLGGKYNNSYDELWLIETPNDYIPVLITDINTSSYMALWSCGIYEDEEQEQISLRGLKNLVGSGWYKNLHKILVNNYIKPALHSL